MSKELCLDFLSVLKGEADIVGSVDEKRRFCVFRGYVWYVLCSETLPSLFRRFASTGKGERFSCFSFACIVTLWPEIDK